MELARGQDLEISWNNFRHENLIHQEKLNQRLSLFKFEGVGKSQWKQLEIEFQIYFGHLSLKSNAFEIQRTETDKHQYLGQLLELEWHFLENDFPAGTKYAGWKVPADTSTMTTRRLMASPCLNNSDSSRRKSLAKVLEDGADFWRLWIALGGLVICKYLIISYLTEFDIKCMAVNLLTWTFLSSWMEWYQISNEATG